MAGDPAMRIDKGGYYGSSAKFLHGKAIPSRLPAGFSARRIVRDFGGCTI